MAVSKPCDKIAVIFLQPNRNMQVCRFSQACRSTAEKCQVSGQWWRLRLCNDFVLKYATTFEYLAKSVVFRGTSTIRWTRNLAPQSSGNTVVTKMRTKYQLKQSWKPTLGSLIVSNSMSHCLQWPYFHLNGVRQSSIVVDRRSEITGNQFTLDYITL